MISGTSRGNAAIVFYNTEREFQDYCTIKINVLEESTRSFLMMIVVSLKLEDFFLSFFPLLFGSRSFKGINSINFQLLKENNICNESLKMLRERNHTSNICVFLTSRNEESPIIPMSTIILLIVAITSIFIFLFYLFFCFIFPYIKTDRQVSVCKCVYAWVCVKVRRVLYH